MKATRRRIDAMTRIAEELKMPKGRAARNKDTIVESALLPAQESDPLYVYFHVDHVDQTNFDTGYKELFLHMMFLKKPSGEPPKPMTDLLKAGKHAGWIVSTIARSVGRGTRALIDVELRLSNVSSREEQLPLPIFTPDNSVEVCGVEYKAKSASDAVRRFRWSQSQVHDGTYDVWMSYMTSAPFVDNDALKTARELCAIHVKRFL